MGFDLSEAIRGQVGSVSAAAMELSQPVEPSERTIDTITEEIEQLKAQGGEVIIEIGKRLNEAKDKLSHGEWLSWLSDRVEFSERTAQDFMRLAREWSNPQTLADLGKAKALKLLLLPPAEREEFMGTHDVPNMSTRELEQAIKRQKELEQERDEAKAAAEWSEKKLGELSKAFDESQTALESEHARTLELNTRIKELESRPVDVAVEVDEKAVQKAAAEAKAAAEFEAAKKIKALEDKLAKAEEKAKSEAAKAEKTAGGLENEAAEAKREADRLREELAALKQEQAKASISGDVVLAQFQLIFEQTQAEVNKMRGLLLKVRGRGDSDTADKLAAAIRALSDLVRGCAE